MMLYALLRLSEKEIMDKLFSKDRKCCICESIITCREFINANKYEDMHYLSKIWNDKRIALACCYCIECMKARVRPVKEFDGETRIKNLKKWGVIKNGR